MRLHDNPRRPGQVLTAFVILLPVFLGMVALVIDGGFLMSGFRDTQNAADAGALAGAMELYQGGTKDAAVAKARQYVRDQTGLSGLTDAQIVVNNPPAAGPYTGNNRYIEVIVRQPVQSYFMQALDLAPSNDVAARAVAGYESGGRAEGVIVLDPRASSFGGLAVSGGAILKVSGALLVNSLGKGVDQMGLPVPSPYNLYGTSTGNNSRIYADIFNLSGGVDVLDNIFGYPDFAEHMKDGSITSQDTNRVSDNPLFARRPVAPDPLKDLPIPVRSQAGVVKDGNGQVVQPSQGSYKVGNGETRVFSEGVYNDITISGGAVVTFNPGQYILSPAGANQGLHITGAPTVMAAGALFYFTGSNYLADPANPGKYDKLDGTTEGASLTTGPTSPPDPQFNQVNFATLDLNIGGGSVTMSGYNNSGDPTDPLNSMLFYFRRRAQGSVAAIQGQAGDQVKLTGGIYTKWGNFKLSGGGAYDAQFVVGSMSISGTAVVTVKGTGKEFGIVQLVYLVE